jgi:hypothetical protein
VVVNTKVEDKLIADLTETFANLREFQWKLNPTNCVFGVASGLLIGFMVGYRGIEVNPAKIDAIRNMAKPSNKKDIIKLTCMMAALGRFISKLGGKGLPFFKLLKKCETWVPLGPHRPGSWSSPTSGSVLLEDWPTCQWAQLT